MRSEDETRMTQIAIALELYKRSQGTYPEKLSELLPRFIAQIPVGIIPGQTFQYLRLAPQSYRLWSFGWDETDEGGEGEREPASGRSKDWVLEIANFE